MAPLKEILTQLRTNKKLNPFLLLLTGLMIVLMGGLIYWVIFLASNNFFEYQFQQSPELGQVIMSQGFFMVLIITSLIGIVSIIASVFLKKKLNLGSSEIKAINNELELVNNVLLDNIHDLVVVIEGTGKINLLNKALKELFRSNYNQTLSPGDSILTYKNDFSTRITSFLGVHTELPQDSSDLVQDQAKCALLGEITLENGRAYEILFSPLGRLADGSGEKRYFFFLHDITDTTTEIKAINNELELVNNVVLDNIHDLVVVIERTGKINLLNKALKELFRSNYNQVLSPGDSILTYKNDFSTRIRSFLSEHKDVPKNSWEFTKNQARIALLGEITLENNRAYEILFSRLGRLADGTGEKRYFFFLHDITDTTIEIKAINNELELVNNVLLDNIHDLVVVIERTGKINLLNKALKDLFRLNYNQVLSPGDSILTYKNVFSTRITSFLTGHKEVPIKPSELTTDQARLALLGEITLENGKSYNILFSPIGRLADGSGEKRYFFFLHDITESKDLEALRSRLISTVSHELRTPITAINLTLQNLVKFRKKLDEEKIEYMFTALLKTGRVLAEMIEDLLTASQIEGGKMKLAPIKFSVFNAMNQIIEQLKSNILQKEITILNELPSNLMIFGDPKRITQVFRILIDNAVKYSPSKKTIEISSIENPPDLVKKVGLEGILLIFKDNGMGIPPADMIHLFQRFYRATNVNQVQGTGLGLVIAKELIELHHGQIWAESELGKGTIFRIFLPKNFSELEKDEGVTT